MGYPPMLSVGYRWADLRGSMTAYHWAAVCFPTGGGEWGIPASVPAPPEAFVLSATADVPAASVPSRHSLLVRVTHWVTAVCFCCLAH